MINESALTGEWKPVDKYETIIEGESTLTERTNMAYMSTLVSYGEATGVVVTAVVVSCQFPLAVGRAAEFPAPDHECLIEHTALLEILDQCRARPPFFYIFILMMFMARIISASRIIRSRITEGMR